MSIAHLFAVAALVNSQDSLVHPAGKPSVIQDTIYSLAVRPSDHPSDDVAYLLTDETIRIDTNGHVTRSHREVMQILREAAIDGQAHHTFSYDPSHERTTIHWVRVVKPDGTVLTDQTAAARRMTDCKEASQQETLRFGTRPHSTHCTSYVDLPQVAVGTILDISTTTEDVQPNLPGDFFMTWWITTTVVMPRTRRVLDVPSTMVPRIHDGNTAPYRTMTRVNDRTIYTWTIRDIPSLDQDRFAADDNPIDLEIDVSMPNTWERVATQYASATHDAYQSTPEIARGVQRLVASARTLDDSIRTIHTFVTTQVPVAVNSDMIHTLVPRLPLDVLTSGALNSHDKATLFITLLREIGVTAYPVLCGNISHFFPEMPSRKQLDDFVVAIPKGNGYRFVDVMTPYIPLGELPKYRRGVFGLIVLPNGGSKTVTLPAGAPVDVDSVVVEATLDRKGRLDGTYTFHAHGATANEIYPPFQSPFDIEKATQWMTSMARRTLPKAALTHAMFPSDTDHYDDVTVRASLQGVAMAHPSNTTDTLIVRPDVAIAIATLANELEHAGARHFPIDAARVWDNPRSVTDIRITLPEGWNAELPSPVVADGIFGTYRAEYHLEGRSLHIVWQMEGKRGVFPKERNSELITWLRTIGNDGAGRIVLKRIAD